MATFAFVVIVLLVETGCTLACSCRRQSTTDKFCKRDFSIAIRVLDEGTVKDSERMYKIHVIRTFRSRTNVMLRGRLLKDRLYTGPHTCGIRLEHNKFYLVSGYIIRGVWGTLAMRTALCDLQVKYPNRIAAYFQRPPVWCPRIQTNRSRSRSRRRG